ncbi:uncharacterized protein LOC141628555 [Silene latifolia]|uniref:uncharacterized protein LOC141628555 n=1 Tax=Silene latifolia TaxID=37657 RepID=UPI003D77E9CC
MTGVYVKVRVVRKWKKEDFRKAFVGEDFSLELILVDEEGHVIQATVGKALIQSFEDKIIEGYTYKIDRFQTFQNRGYDIATAHKCRLRLDPQQQSKEFKHSYPKAYISEFVSIINQIVSSFFDVIAEVDAYDMLSNINNLERTYLVLEDLKNANRPPRTRGIVHVKTKDILARNLKTIDELKNIEKAGTYVIVAYITKIDDIFKWYYDGWKVCTYRLEKGLMDYGIAHKKNVFQAKFYIEDAHGGKAFIKIFDKLIKMKVNKSVMQCIDKLREVKNEHGIPTEIKEFQHKEYVFKVEVDNRFNLQLNSKCYNDIASITDMLAISAETTVENLTTAEGSTSSSETVPMKKKYADISVGEETTAANNAGSKESASKKMKSIKIEKE